MARTKKHPGTLRLKGDVWHLRLSAAGKPHYFTLGAIPKADAVDAAWAKKRELDKQTQRSAAGLPGSVCFSEMLALYKRDELPTLSDGTRRAYADSFTFFELYFVNILKDPALDRIRAKHILQYLSWRRNQRRTGKNRKPDATPLSNRTLQKDRAVLHRMFAFADALELRDGNPVARVEAPKADDHTPVLLTPEQFEKLLTQCEQRPMLWLYALTLAETGGRCYSEILHLRWEDVDLAEGFIQIRSGRDGHRTKSGKSRYVPMTPRLHVAMREHFARFRFAAYGREQSAWVFHHVTTRRGCVAGERMKSFRAGFDKAALAAGLPQGFRRHDMRHMRATSWLAAGANPVHVKEALGHADLRTTMGYTHLAKEHLRSLVSSPVPVQSVTDDRKPA